VLLADRRQALINFCLAGIDAAWITPLWLFVWRPGASVGASYALLLLGLLAWILVLDLLGRTPLVSPLYDLVALGLMAAAGLLLVRVVLYPGWPLTGLGWLGQVLEDIRRSPGRFPPALALLLVNALLWWRATAATSRDITFFSVGMAFRRGLLLLIAGAGAYGQIRGRSLAPLLWVYFSMGLTAVALARIHDKSGDADSVGSPLPLRRLAQLLAAVAATVGVAGLLTRFYTAEGLGVVIRLLLPVWRLVSPLLFWLLRLLVEVLSPLFLWLESLLTAMMQGRELRVISPTLAPAGPAQAGAAQQVMPSYAALLLKAVGIAAIAVALLVALGFLLLYLEKARQGRARAEEEIETAEPVALPGGLLSQGIRSLREAARLLRRFGVSRQLLAAISVQNIYANLCRLARRRGYPRRPAQPPDAYLPALVQAFGGQEDALRHITAAYMRVHYGDHPVTAEELAALRADYRQVRAALQSLMESNTAG